MSLPEPKLIRILYISRAHGLNSGGMERLSFRVLEGYRKADSVSVVALVPPVRQAHSLFWNRAQSVAFALRVFPAAFWMARSCDVVHLGDPVLAKIGWLIKVFWHKPVAVTMHGLDVTYPNRLYQMYLRFFFTKFDQYFPISQAAAGLLAKFKVSGQVTVITPGVDDWFDPAIYTRAELAAMLKINTDKKIVLLTIGRLVARKGQAWFIQNVLPSLDHRFIYVVAGDGPEYAPLAAWLNVRPDISSRVHLLGRVSEDNLKLLYHTADAFIQPNVPLPGELEGFGIVLLEAAMCELPVFASDLEGIRDAVTPTKNGALITPADPAAWVKALHQFYISPRRSTEARDFTKKNYSWNLVTPKYVLALRRLA